MAADTALAHLGAMGAPDGGWLPILGQIRQSEWLALRLPRPGDPRGVALPPDIAVDAALAWSDRDRGLRLLIPTGPGGSANPPLSGRDAHWDIVDVGQASLPMDDPAECDRALRSQVVEAAHLLDAVEDPMTPYGDGERGSMEALVDSWLLGPPPLPSARRSLAGMALRVLLATSRIDASARIDASGLERAARAALEASYSLTDG